jgi:hypothetical protein
MPSDPSTCGGAAKAITKNSVDSELAAMSAGIYHSYELSPLEELCLYEHSDRLSELPDGL